MQDDRQIPRWDSQTRKLWVGDQLVKHFRQPAANQERVLAAFEEQGWPPRIDDPLPGDGLVDRHDRLRETICSLNGHQVHELIHFQRDGTGNGLMWEFRFPSPDGVGQGEGPADASIPSTISIPPPSPAKSPSPSGRGPG